MAKRLVENITSRYFEASSALHNKPGRVIVYVEGYDDISFWRTILDEFETPERRFEISTPARSDLAKGKKVVLQFADRSGPHLLLCVDSDFDYLFGDINHQSRQVNDTPYIIQTYTYAVENYLCYAPSLHSLCTRVTKRDQRIFDFEEFMAEYSRIIFPVFVWYVYAARINRPVLFTLSDFRNAVKINFVHVEDNGDDTLAWLKKQVTKRLKTLREKHSDRLADVERFEGYLTQERGVEPEETYLYMQGHTLFENVVSVLVGTVCNSLRKLAIGQIMESSRKGIQLNNELSSYNNALSDAEEMLKSNAGYQGCSLFRKLHRDIEKLFQDAN